MGIGMLSVSFWGAEIINSTGWLMWSDQSAMQLQANAFGWADEGPLALIWLSPFPTAYPIINLLVSIIALLMMTGVFVLIGQSAFKKREIH